MVLCCWGGSEVPWWRWATASACCCARAQQCTHPTLLHSQVRHLMETHWKALHLSRGYQLLYTPHIAKVDLWKTSGHWDFYRESMFNQVLTGCCVRPRPCL